MEAEELQDLTSHRFYKVWLCSVLDDYATSSLTIPSDLQNGIIFCKCIKKLRGTDLKPVSKDLDNIQTWQSNVNLVLDFLSSIKAKPDVTLEYIVQGDISTLFSLLDSIILHLDIHSPDRAAYQRTITLGKKLMVQWIYSQVPMVQQVFTGNLIDCFWDGQIFQKLASRFCGCQVPQTGIYTEAQCSQTIAICMGRFEENLNVPRGFFNPVDLAQRKLEEYVLLVYLAVLRRKITSNKNLVVSEEIPLATNERCSSREVSPQRVDIGYDIVNGLSDQSPGSEEKKNRSFASQSNVSTYSDPLLTQQQQQERLHMFFEKLQRSRSPIENKPRPITTGKGSPHQGLTRENGITISPISDAEGDNASLCSSSTEKSNLGHGTVKALFHSESTPPLRPRRSVDSEISQPFSELMALAAEKGYTGFVHESPKKGSVRSFSLDHNDNHAQTFIDCSSPLNSSSNTSITSASEAIERPKPAVDISSLTDAVQNFHLTTPVRKQHQASSGSHHRIEQESRIADELVREMPEVEGIVEERSPTFKNPPSRRNLVLDGADEVQDPQFIPNTTPNTSKGEKGRKLLVDLENLSNPEDYYKDDMLIYLDYMYILALSQETAKEMAVVEVLQNVKEALSQQAENFACPTEISTEINKTFDEVAQVEVEKYSKTASNDDDTISGAMEEYSEESLSKTDKIRELEFENSVMKRRLESFEKRQLLTNSRMGIKDDVNDKLQTKLNKANEKIASLMKELGKVNELTIENNRLGEENRNLLRKQTILEDALSKKKNEIDAKAMLGEISSLENSLNDLRRDKESVDTKYLLKKKECQDLKLELRSFRRPPQLQSAPPSITSIPKMDSGFTDPLQVNKVKASGGGDQPLILSDLPDVMVVTTPKAQSTPSKKNYSTEDTRLFVKSMEERLEQSKSTIRTALRNSYRT